MESSGRTLVCSVLFLDIVEYSRKPVSEQLQLKQEFNRVLAKSLEQVPARDRIILDTGDGAAVTFMGDPEDALFASMAVRDSAGALAVQSSRACVSGAGVRDVRSPRDDECGDGWQSARARHVASCDEARAQSRPPAATVGVVRDRDSRPIP